MTFRAVTNPGGRAPNHAFRGHAGVPVSASYFFTRKGYYPVLLSSLRGGALKDICVHRMIVVAPPHSRPGNLLYQNHNPVFGEHKCMKTIPKGPERRNRMGELGNATGQETGAKPTRKWKESAWESKGRWILSNKIIINRPFSMHPEAGRHAKEKGGYSHAS